jgi:aminopeptidase N
MSASSTSDKSAGRVLLPDYIMPTNYDLKLIPDLVKFSFDGLLTISFLASKEIKESQEITLHSKELMYREAKVILNDGKEVLAEEINVNTKTTMVTFVFPEPVIFSDSPLKLKVDFVGCLNNQMAGFYRSTYKDYEGKEKIVASTQFEALDARRCFPCVDEPAAKATFLVTLVVPRNLECFSNMPEAKRITLDGDLVEVSFLESPKMSTYLLSVCVGEFDFVQAQNEHGVLIKVYAPRGRSASCQYALDCACKALDAYDNFFGVRYPLPKLDMVVSTPC